MVQGPTTGQHNCEIFSNVSPILKFLSAPIDCCGSVNQDCIDKLHEFSAQALLSRLQINCSNNKKSNQAQVFRLGFQTGFQIPIRLGFQKPRSWREQEAQNCSVKSPLELKLPIHWQVEKRWAKPPRTFVTEALCSFRPDSSSNFSSQLPVHIKDNVLGADSQCSHGLQEPLPCSPRLP